MAGQRLTQRMFDAIEACGGEDLVFPLLADGITLTSVCRRIKAAFPHELEELSRGVLSTWCNRPERKERYLEARRTGAMGFAEDSVELIDGAPPTKEGIAKAKAQSDTRRWIAGKLDHDAWGDRTQAGTVINVNQLHLQAVRELGAASAQPALEDRPGEGVIEGDWLEVGEEDWLD